MKLVSRKRLGFDLTTIAGVIICTAISSLARSAQPASAPAPYHNFDRSEAASARPAEPRVPLVVAHATLNSSPLTGIKILPSSVSLDIP
ncbi:MAG: hypothetical protein ACRD06_09440, partial [Terriglobia bacterium]